MVTDLGIEVYESFPAISTLVRNMCEQIITPPFQFDNLLTQVPKSLYLNPVWNLPKCFHNFFWLGLWQNGLFKKSPKNVDIWF